MSEHCEHCAEQDAKLKAVEIVCAVIWEQVDKWNRAVQEIMGRAAQTGINIDDVGKLSERIRCVLARLDDDELAAVVAAECHDPAHDSRWCSTCEIREAGIEDYRRAVKGEGK